ncbi:hypothetical protein C8A05DRAFT_32420 [Staphylotrichum tortipilum]|uniref:Uncharacterized protein n=1 Tax=Staphylotrichum tortipilum TaxID=2831512 RepID=A0AAN6RVC1_9PEZI|nr:hypothetical protein C8A05DRAFT_32420 [Staphylotrichum longicolle]
MAARKLLVNVRDAENLPLSFIQRLRTSLFKTAGDLGTPISLLDDVSKNPDKYREMLRYWQWGMMADPDQWAIYGGQVMRWRDFREWQAKRRKIEYLAYECNVFTKFDLHRHRVKWYQEQWDKLAESGILRPHETDEVILDWDASLQRSSEETRAENAVKSARWWAQQGTAATQAALNSPVQAHQSIKNRHDRITEFITTTRRYREAKRDAKRHNILVEWVKEQVPLIVVEMVQARAAEGNLDAKHGETQGTTKRASDDEDAEEHDRKRQRALPGSRIQTPEQAPVPTKNLRSMP